MKANVAAAPEEALSSVAEVEAETALLSDEPDAALHPRREQAEAESATLLARITTLRAIADDLEAKELTPSNPPPTPPTPPSPPSSTSGGGTADAPQAKTDSNHQDGAAPSAEKIRESFSGRRSAKLPRIGEEAGRNAIAAATAMRAQLSPEPTQSNNKDQEDIAVRTA